MVFWPWHLGFKNHHMGAKRIISHIARATLIAKLIVAPLYCVNVNAGNTQESTPEYYSFYIVQEYWHTGIIVETALVPDSLWPSVMQFRNHRYIDIGWGEEFFYQEPETNAFHALRAVLWPTPSAIRVHGFRTEPSLYYGTYATLFKIKATPEEFYHLIKFIANSFKYDDDGNIIPSHTSSFFKAKRNYHLFRTCNTWVCKGLSSSGYRVRYRAVITRRQLVRQVRRINTDNIERIS